MQPVLKFNVRNQNISRVDTFLPVRYSRNYLYAQFYFKTCDWNEKTKTAIFSGTGLEPIPVILGETDTCLVPWEVLECTEFTVTVHAGDLITVDSAKVKLYESGYRPGGVPEPTPDVYQQLINMLTDQVDGLSYTDNILSLMAGEKSIASVTITGGSGSGTDGREIELQNDGIYIQWRYSGEEVWNNLISLSDLTGKSAYEYAKEGGYTGTEEEFSQKLKKEIPDVDSILNEESENAIQNKAVAKAISKLSDEINNLREQVESGSVGGGSGTSSEVKTILQRIQTEIKACIRDDSVCPNTYIDATDNLINNLGTGSGGEPVDPNPPIEEPDVPTPSNKYRATIIDPVPLTYADRSNYTNFDWKAIDGGGRFAFKEKTFTGTVYIRCFLATRYISGAYLPKIYTNDSETVSYTNLVKLDASEYFGNDTVVTPYGLDADGNITDAPVNGFMYIAKYEIPSGKYGVLIFDANNNNSAFKQGAKGTTAVFYSDITSDVTTMDIEEV